MLVLNLVPLGIMLVLNLVPLGLRPVLSAMDADNQNKFANDYVKAIAEEYPALGNNKILLPFRRIFMVGYK
jgi:trans-aconitate 2-methyltransferase